MKRIFLAVAGLLSLAAGAEAAGPIPNQAVIANETALAFNTTYFLDISQVGKVAMQVNVGSATIGSGTFTDGSVSTGNLTVVSFTALSSATATGSITIASNTATFGTCVSGGGPGIPGNFNVCNPRDWVTDSASSQTAANLATAIDSAFGLNIATSAIGPIVYASAPVYGLAWNSFQISVSSYGAETLSTLISSIPFQVGYSSMNGVGIGHLTGGQDNQSFTINGQVFRANQTGAFGFYPVTSTAQTATNIATAINNSSSTLGIAAAAGSVSTTVIFATSTAVGLSTRYTMVSSSNAALSLSPSVALSGSQGTGGMTGGTNAAYTINTATISISGNAFTKGLPVVYSTASATALNGLAYGTTYFVVPIPGPGPSTTFGLASSLANALVGASQTIPLTSSQTSVTADSFILTPSVISGTPVLKWLVSQDRTNWTPLTTSVQNVTVNTLSVGSYVNPSSSTWWDPGQVDYNWLGLGVTAPTQGGITLKAFVSGKN